MRLKDATKRFHDALATDAYTGEELFHCSFTSFDDHSATGATARRRVLNLPEDIVLPTRRCINLYSEIWIVGVGSPDSFGGSIVRVAYGMKKATDLATIGTPAQTILNTATTRAFIYKQFVRDTFNTRSESDTNVNWDVFIAPGETIQTGDLITTPDTLMRVRKAYLPVEGLRILECDDLPENYAQTAVFVENGVYDSATDSYSDPGSLSTPVFIFDYNQLYRLHTQSDDKYEAGDLSVLVPQSALTPLVSAYFNMLGRTWRVLTVQPELDCWLLHARAS